MKRLEEVLLEAIRSCNNEPKMPIRAAVKDFQVPRAGYLQIRINRKIENGAKTRRKSLMPLELEEKLLEVTKNYFADKRARMGIGFEKEKFLTYAGKLANKYYCSFKNS